MKSHLVLLLIFLLALIQGAVLPLNLVLLVVLVWTVIRLPKESLLVAFFSGIFLDLATGMPLGFSSILYLISCLLIILYSRCFDPTHPAFLPLFVFLASVIYNLISKEPWLVEGTILAILALLARPLIKFYQEEVYSDKLRLKI